MPSMGLENGIPSSGKMGAHRLSACWKGIREENERQID